MGGTKCLRSVGALADACELATWRMMDMGGRGVLQRNSSIREAGEDGTWGGLRWGPYSP